MCLLDVELTLDRNIITMEVKAQDEKLRGTLSFVSSQGIRIVSRNFPQITWWEKRKCVCVRGEEPSKDHNLSACTFESPEQARRVALQIKEAFLELNDSYIERGIAPKLIDYQVFQHGNWVAFCINNQIQLEPGYVFRPKIEGSYLNICSADYPMLTNKAIYLRGTVKSLDYKIATREFDSREVAERYACLVSASLEHWMQETKNDFKNVIQINIKGETK